MGFLSNAFKHPGWYAGGLGLGLAMNNFGQPEASPALPFKTGPAKTAKDVTLDSSLTRTLGGIGDTQGTAISGAYGRARTQAAADARPTGSYYGQRLGTGEALSQGNLRSGLENVLGGEGYADWKSKRDFDENMALAQFTGELMKPSTTEEVMAGLGGGAQAGGQFYGLYNALSKRPAYSSAMQPYTQSSAPNPSYYMSGGSGLNLYGY